MTSDAEKTVRGFYDRLYIGHFDVDAIHPRIRWQTPATLPWTLEDRDEVEGIVEYRGMAELAIYLTSLRQEVDGMIAKADTFIADGNRIVVLGRESGTARRTKRTFVAPFAHVVTVEASLIRGLHGYIDTVLVARAFAVAEAGELTG